MLIYMWSKPLRNNVFNNDFRLLSIYGGTEWTLSSTDDTIKFLKASESDRILGFSRSFVWFG